MFTSLLSGLLGSWVFGGLLSWRECRFHFSFVWSRAWGGQQSAGGHVVRSVQEMLPHFTIYQVFRKQILKYYFSLNIFLSVLVKWELEMWQFEFYSWQA